MTKTKFSPLSSEGREAPAADVAFERELASFGADEKRDDRDTSEDFVRELTSSVRNAIVDGRATSLEHWKTELEEIASLAADIDISLRRARDRHGEGKRARPRQDIDLVAGEVAIDGTKTAGSKPTVPVTPISKPLLELALAGLPQGQEQYRRWQNLRRDVLAACKRAGVPDISLNDLRRSFATWHLEAGVSNVLVAKYLGHTTTEMVDRTYGRPSVESLKKLTEKYFASKKPATKVDEPKEETQGDAQKPEVPVTVPRRRQRASDHEPDGAPPLH